MLKGIFICALLAVLSANSMAQPTDSKDPDVIKEQEVKGIDSEIFSALKNFEKAGLNAVNQKQEATLPKREAINSAPSKRFISLLLRPLMNLFGKGKRDGNSI